MKQQIIRGEAMKTLILNGSPRANGDTVSLIKELTKKLPGEYKIVDAYHCDVSPCVDCRYCWEHPGCAIADEMQEIYAYIQECDNILIASPVYFSELTGKLLDLPQPPTAIMYPDDFAYLGGIAEIRNRGLQVPDQVSVTGYDGITLSSVIQPSLVTWHQNADQIGRRSVQKLVETIDLIPEPLKLS